MQTIRASFEVGVNNNPPVSTGTIVKTADTYFIVEVALDQELESVNFLITDSTGIYYNKDATKQSDNKWSVRFDTKFITKYDVYKLYVYGSDSESEYDIGYLTFEGRPSEISVAVKGAKQIYFQSLQEVVDEARLVLSNIATVEQAELDRLSETYLNTFKALADNYTNQFNTIAQEGKNKLNDLAENEQADLDNLEADYRRTLENEQADLDNLEADYRRTLEDILSMANNAVIDIQSQDLAIYNRDTDRKYDTRLDIVDGKLKLVVRDYDTNISTP